MTTLKTLGIEEVAALLQRKVATVRSDVSRRPHTLPPRLEIPGTKTVVWLEQDVLDWLLQLRGNGAKRKARPR